MRNDDPSKKPTTMPHCRRMSDAYLDRCLQLQQYRLRDEDLTRLCAEVSDLVFQQLHLFSRPTAANLKQTLDDRVEVDLSVRHVDGSEARSRRDRMNVEGVEMVDQRTRGAEQQMSVPIGHAANGGEIASWDAEKKAGWGRRVKEAFRGRSSVCDGGLRVAATTQPASVPTYTGSRDREGRPSLPPLEGISSSAGRRRMAREVFCTRYLRGNGCGEGGGARKSERQTGLH